MNTRKAIIRSMAEKIMQELTPRNGIQPSLYGEPVDIKNPEHLLAAAWLLGYEAKAREAARETYQLLTEAHP